MVEKLLKQRTRGDTVEYLVRWKRFSDDHDSWEPEKNLHNCHAEMESFKKRSSPPVTPIKGKTQTPKRSPSRSRSRAQSKSPARKKSASPVKSKSSPKTPRTRSRSRTRLASAVKISAEPDVVKKRARSVSSSRTKSATKKTTVTTTTRSRSRSRAGTVATPALDTSGVTAFGEPGRYTHTVQTHGKKTQLESVVVPRSLQPSKPSSQKGFLEEVTLKDIILIVIVSLIIVVTVANHYKYIDLNEYLKVVKSNIEAITSPKTPASSRSPGSPPAQASSTTTRPPK